MSRTVRTVLLLLIVIVLLAVVVVVVLPQLNAPPPQPAEIPAAQQPTEPEATPLPTATPIRFVELVVALQELPRGFRIPETAVALQLWPEDAAPFNAATSLQDVVGRLARTDIFREQPILTNMVVDDFLSLARVGSDAAAVLPNGLVAVAIPVDRLTSVAYAVQDGDRVDLIISLLFVDVDEEFQTLLPNVLSPFVRDPETTALIISQPIRGRLDTFAGLNVFVEPSEEATRPRLVTQRTIQDALVVHVGNFPPDGRFIGVPPTPTPVPVEDDDRGQNTPPPPTPTPTRPDIITLGVPPQEAVLLTWLVEARVPVTLALRSVNDASRSATTPVTLDYIMRTYGIEVPAKRDYSIEPAIRSIRQLIAGETIRLAAGPQ